MRFIKALLCFFAAAAMAALLLYQAAELATQPLAAARLLPFMALLCIMPGAVLLGYCDEGALLLRLPCYCLCCLLPQAAVALYMAADFCSLRGWLLYAAACLVAGWLTAYTARLLYRRKKGKNEE